MDFDGELNTLNAVVHDSAPPSGIQVMVIDRSDPSPASSMDYGFQKFNSK
jgi:hypothetical protein